MMRDTKIKAEERFPITGQGFCFRKIIGQHGMSNFVRHRCYKIIHVSVLFVIPVIINVHGHRFEIFILVSEIHDNVDLVMAMKNIFELEGVIDSRDLCFSFLSRSHSILPSDDSRDCTKNTKDGYNRGPFHRGIIRDGHGKDFRHQRANHKHDKIEIH